MTDDTGVTPSITVMIVGTPSSGPLPESENASNPALINTTIDSTINPIATDLATCIFY